MRVSICLAGLLLAGAAQAADLPLAPSGAVYSPLGRHAGPLIVYDDEPGIVMRAYWLAPWRNRHYFPMTREPPAIGRDEDLSASGAPPEPAETFYRQWSTAVPPARGPLPTRPLK